MEPNIIDYYNEMPSCYHTIEKLNTEFETLQKEKNLLEQEKTRLLELGKKGKLPITKEYRKQLQLLVNQDDDI